MGLLTGQYATGCAKEEGGVQDHSAQSPERAALAIETHYQARKRVPSSPSWGGPVPGWNHQARLLWNCGIPVPDCIRLLRVEELTFRQDQ